MSNYTPNLFASLDLEMNQPSGKIIQIGAAIGNIKEKTILDTFSVFINPNEQLIEFIIKLTGINQHDVDHGVDLLTGYLQMVEFMKKYNPSPMILEWGQGDCRCLKEQLKEFGNPKWEFGRTSMNVKNIHQFQQIQKNERFQGGLAKALLRNNLKFDGRKHNAMDDAKNTMLVFFKMLENYAK